MNGLGGWVLGVRLEAELVSAAVHSQLDGTHHWHRIYTGEDDHEYG